MAIIIFIQTLTAKKSIAILMLISPIDINVPTSQAPLFITILNSKSNVCEECCLLFCGWSKKASLFVVVSFYKF